MKIISYNKLVNKDKYIIGVSAFYHDSSACLFRNGKLLFACEEERFSGIKHDSSFPKNTIDYIFKKYKLSKEDITAVCYYEEPKLKFKRVWDNFKTNIFKAPIHVIKSLIEITSNRLKIHKSLKTISDTIFYSEHHKSHLYYSVATSDFLNSDAISVDGVGEIDTVSYGSHKEKSLKYKSLARYPHSLGLFYTAMTSYLGFKPNEGEYKVMGLASYGSDSKYVTLVGKLIKFEAGKLNCDMDKFCWDRDDKLMFNYKLVEHLGILPRDTKEPITVEHEKLAYAVQQVYENVFFNILNHISSKSKNKKLCLSGGCAYNGTANGKITKNTNYKKLWIPSAPSDAGSSIGACVNYLIQTDDTFKGKVTKNPFLGPDYDYGKVIKSINPSKVVKYNSEEELLSKVAEEIHNEKVIGWFYGNIEFGARALGNRSILASPLKVEMKDKINKVIKKREGFRPFAPMVLQDAQDKYFETDGDVPYMNQVVKVRTEYQQKLGAVTHVDGTARIQTISTTSNKRIYNLLQKYDKLSGYPIILNTSFNVKDKTMVLTPKDALDTFFDTQMDYLVMGNYLIHK
jgi:carbamoyltransferase